MRVIGLDVGEKRIGVARADSSTRIAVPIQYINVDGSEWEEISHVARLNGTNFFVLGMPRSNEGNETAQSQYVRSFAKDLLHHIPEAKIRFQDESLTSVLAEERLKSTGRKYEKGEIDSEAAAIILQDFLEGLGSSADVNGSTISEDAQDPPLEDRKLGRAALSASEKGGSERLLEVADFTKKQSDKVKLNTKKAKHKMKTATKWISSGLIILIVGMLAVGAFFIIREQRYKEYAEQFAQMEAEMQENSVFEFSILPGETIFDVKKKLIEVGYSATEVDAALNKNYDFSFLKGRPEGATLEGYLYGETHEFYKDTPAEEVIETFLEGMGKVISENNLEQAYAARGLTLYEGITLASVVQKEAASEDQPTVAQVFLSRLDAGMLLGSDVTVSYALDVVDPGRVTYGNNTDALTVDSCYNTRLYGGLPCGPISNPGLSALLAVANPSDTSYLYFLTGDDGMMYYSYTEDEHIQNIYSHCQHLCNVSL